MCRATVEVLGKVSKPKPQHRIPPTRNSANNLYNRTSTTTLVRDSSETRREGGRNSKNKNSIFSNRSSVFGAGPPTFRKFSF